MVSYRIGRGMARACVATLALAVFARPAAAQTVFLGGSLTTATNWSNGLPVVTNNGTIATAGTFPVSFNFNQNVTGGVTVSHTAGTLTGGTFNFFNGPASTATGWATYNWVQTGGTLTTTNLFPNLRFTYTLAGGAVSTTSPTTAVINTFNTGVFNQSGGTTAGFAYQFDDASLAVKTHTLSGGTGTGVRQFAVGNQNTVVMDGSFSLTFSTVATTFDIGPSGGGVLNIQDGWTGSWTRDNFAVANWQTILTKAGVQFEGVQVTDANFSSIFAVTSAGSAGSNVHLIAPVPEPASVLGFAAAGLGCYRLIRRRMRTA